MFARIRRHRLCRWSCCAALLCGSLWHPRGMASLVCNRPGLFISPESLRACSSAFGQQKFATRVARTASDNRSPSNSQAAAIEALEALRRNLPAEEGQTDLESREPAQQQSRVAARHDDQPQRVQTNWGAQEAQVLEVPGQPPHSSAVVDPASPAQANFVRIYDKEEWGVEARSGLGSREDTTREIRPILEQFLREQGIKSMVDAGCGHWPSGYQRFMQWQGVHYVGVDVVPFVVEENKRYFADAGNRQRHGVASADCLLGDVGSNLPSADLLLVKDVLMHLPNAAIQNFIENNLDRSAPKYRFVLLVQNEVPMNFRAMMDIEPGQLLPFDITAPPFSAQGFETIFRWQSDEPKSVQLWRP